jgi:glycosyltransferase involved in cell wall biosynthesis
MRIIHCLRAPVGGLFRHVLDLAAAQAQRGHEVGLIADSRSEDALTERKFAAVAAQLALGVTRIPMSRQPGLGDWRAARAVEQIAAPLDIDVLHGHGAKGGAYARLAGQNLTRKRRPAAGPKVFYTPHGGTLNFSPRTIEGRIYFTLERYLARATDGLIFESAHAARAYRERIGDQNVPQRVIPNGLGPGDFEPVRPHPSASDVLFVGELRSLKGVDVLLNALARLNQQRPVTATIVGAGPDAEAFKSLAATLELDSAVTFTGALPARQAFAMGRIMTVPSRAESFPYIVLEAGAAGLPLIATSVGGIPEIVAGTDTGLIAPDDIMALARAIADVLDHPASAAERAERLRAQIADKFTVAAMTAAVLDFYEETLS